MLESFKISSELPLWLILICLLISVIVVYISYGRETKLAAVSKSLKFTLYLLRGLLAFILAFLILKPFVKSGTRHLQEPILVVGIDNSTSMAVGDSSLSKDKVNEIMESFEKDLQDKFSIKWNLVGNSVRSGKDVSLDEKETNLSSFIESLENNYFNRNVGAAVLFSDGLFNSGKNPVYLTSSFEYPIHTVLMGDTSIHRDASISRVKHNQIAYLGNRFEIIAHIEAEKLNGQRTMMSIEHNGQVLVDTSILYSRDHFFASFPFYIKATESGIQHYIIRLKTTNGELYSENNVKHVYIEVLEGRQKILLLAAAPHPDIAAISNAVLNNDKYELTVQLPDEFDGNLEPYQLLILHQNPSKRGKKIIMQAIEQSEIPKWYIQGARSNQRNMAKLLSGFEMIGLSSNQEALPTLNTDFPLFTISEQLKNQIVNWPPLRVPHESNQYSNLFEPLFYQQIGSVKTPYLLWGFSKVDGVKTTIITGEGLWKWRLHDYLRNESHEVFDNLIQSTVQYMGLNEDKSRFRLSNDNLFNENEVVEFGAELYNESYELVNQEQVSMVIVDSSGNEYQRTFITSGNRYYLDAGRFDPGEYTYKASTTLGNESFTDQGVFTVTELLLEQNQLIADVELLRNLSHKHSGELFFLNQLEHLKTKLLNDEEATVVSHYTFDVRYLIDFKWLFALILVLFSLEWFLRKRNGLY